MITTSRKRIRLIPSAGLININFMRVAIAGYMAYSNQELNPLSNLMKEDNL